MSQIKVPKLNAAAAGPKPSAVRKRADRHELEELESSFWTTLFGKRVDAPQPAGQARSRGTSRAGMRSYSRGELRPASRTAAKLPDNWDPDAPPVADEDFAVPPPLALDELRALAAAARAAAPSPAFTNPTPRAVFLQSARPMDGSAANVAPRVHVLPAASAARTAAAARRAAPTAQPLPVVVKKTEEQEAREELGDVTAPAPSYAMAPLYGTDTRSGAASGYGATEAAVDLGSAGAWWNSSVYVNPGAEPSPVEDLQRVAANVVLVVTQLVSPNLSMAKLSTMHLGGGAKTLLSPAPYAATVWNVIYAGCVLYALFQSPLLAREAPLLRRLGWYTAGAFAATSAWAALVSLADRGPFLPTSLAVVTAGAAPLAWAIAFCTAVTWALLSLVLRGLAQHVHPFTLGEHLFVVMPLSLYAGWVTILTAVNYGGAMLASGADIVSILSPHRAVAGMLVLAAGGVCTAEVVAVRGNPWYALGAVWGLAGIAASNWRFHDGLNVLSIAAVVGSCAILIAAAIRVALLRRRKWRVPWGAARLLFVRLRACAGRDGRGPGMFSALRTRITTGHWPRAVGAPRGDIEAAEQSPVQLQMMSKPGSGSATKSTPPTRPNGGIPPVKPGAKATALPSVAARPATAAPANTPVSSPAAKPGAALPTSQHVAAARPTPLKAAPPPRMPESPRQPSGVPRTTTRF